MILINTLPIIPTNMEALSIYEAIIILGSLVGVYIKLNNEISKLKNRVYTLEQSKDEVKDMLKELSEDIGEIKLLLARKQISE
jgi:prefoldin subunit 5